jgi:hypothetical protein
MKDEDPKLALASYVFIVGWVHSSLALPNRFGLARKQKKRGVSPGSGVGFSSDDEGRGEEGEGGYQHPRAADPSQNATSLPD